MNYEVVVRKSAGSISTEEVIVKYQSGRRVPLISATAALLLAVTACSDSNGVGAEVEADTQYDLEGQSISIGTAALSPMDIGTARAMDILRSWGADVTHEELTDVSGLQALVANRIDVSARSSDEVIEAAMQDVPMVAFGGSASAMHYVIVGDPDIESVADLRGKRIATSGPGGFDTNLFDALFADEGMSRDADVTEVAIGGSGERSAALLAGQADATMIFLNDWIAMSTRTDDVDLVGYVADMLPGMSARTIAATRDWLDSNGELAEAVACANLEANRWINDNPEEYADYVSERVTGIDEESISRFREEALELGLFPTEANAVLNLDQYEQTAEVLVSGGVLDSPPSLTDSVDTSFLAQAAEKGCGGS